MSRIEQIIDKCPHIRASFAHSRKFAYLDMQEACIDDVAGLVDTRFTSASATCAGCNASVETKFYAKNIEGQEKVFDGSNLLEVSKVNNHDFCKKKTTEEYIDWINSRIELGLAI